MNRISLLQRQQAFQRDAIKAEHHYVDVCKDQIKWLKGVPDIVSTQKRIDVLYRCIEGSRKRIAKLVEMQKFTKGQLQEAYIDDKIEKRYNSGCRDLIHTLISASVDHIKNWSVPASSEFLWINAPGGIWYADTKDIYTEYKHNPKFMGEAPAVEMGSVVGDEL